MKKYAVLFVCCLIMPFVAAAVHAQGFTGPQGFTGQPGFTGQYGFTGPSQTVTVAQVKSFRHKTPAILTGNIVSFLGGDRYLFRDSSGDIVIKIKRNRWWGVTAGPSDRVEIGGELKREKRSWWVKYFDAKTIRMAP